MASTGSIGMTRPMKKVTQVRPRKVSATENSTSDDATNGPDEAPDPFAIRDGRRGGDASRARTHHFVIVR